jgi:hypothetical protein
MRQAGLSPIRGDEGPDILKGIGLGKSYPVATYSSYLLMAADSGCGL